MDNSILPTPETPYASEVASGILNDVNTEYDFTTWKSFTDREQAECYRELIAEIACYKIDRDLNDHENLIVFRAMVLDKLNAQLTGAARDEGYN